MTVIARRAAASLVAVALAASLISCGAGSVGSGGDPGGRNGRIVFSNYGRERTGLYSVRPDGSGRRKHARGLIETAEVSPDGSRVAFTTGRRQVMAVDIDSSKPRTLTTGRTFKLGLAWSPDGEHLAFESIRYRFEGDIRIGVVDSEGGDQRFLTSARAYSTSPSWFPDGRRIVYGCERFSGNFGDVCVIGTDGSGKRVLVGSEFDEEDPALSPDGEHVALIAYGGHESPGQVVVVAADSGEEVFRTAPTLNVERAEWSPDASKLAYLTCRASSCRLHVVAPDGSDEKAFAVDEVYDLVWAPDGSAIAFGQARVKVLDLESGAVTRIAGDRNNQAAPLDWQPRRPQPVLSAGAPASRAFRHTENGALD